MEKINNWFTELKEQEPYNADLIDKIVVGINESGFNSIALDTWILQELKGIETTYKTELKEDRNDENQEYKD